MARARDDGARREKPLGKLARFADARKANNDLLTDIERHLLYEATLPEERRQDVIHPSEMAKTGWCPKATYLRIKLAREGRLAPREAHRFQLENIFEEGHEYHRKWQDRLRRMGRLRGWWLCLSCSAKWEDVSPERCVDCDSTALSYREVGLVDREHLIHGSADGEVTPAPDDDDGETVLIEIKSIGEGTVRIEMPSVLMRYSYEVETSRGSTRKVIDQQQVWRDITHPFAPHLRQGLIYLRLRALRTDLPPVDKIVFIYEYKPTSAVKTFEVRRDDDLVQELWDQAADVVYGLKSGKAPRCVSRDGECDECKPYTEQEQGHDSGAATSSGEPEGEPARRRRAREEAAGPAEEAAGGSSLSQRRPDRPRGRGADGPAGEVHSVGRLFGSAARPRGRR